MAIPYPERTLRLAQCKLISDETFVLYTTPNHDSWPKST